MKNQHEEDLKRIESFRLIDDDFMNACFDGNNEAVELILSIILNKPSIKVSRVETQKLMKNLAGRDICLDIDASSEGKEYNIEIQRADKGAEPDRARAHSSIIDAHALRPGEPFSALPETYVIFITENDVLGEGEPIYPVERVIMTSGKLYGDREHIIYVNGADRNSSTDLGKLMHDFFCTKADEMNFSVLAEKLRYFKESEEGVKSMCKVLEDMRESVREETAQETTVDHLKEIMEKLKYTLDQAMDLLSIPSDQRALYSGLVQK